MEESESVSRHILEIIHYRSLKDAVEWVYQRNLNNHVDHQKVKKIKEISLFHTSVLKVTGYRFRIIDMASSGQS